MDVESRIELPDGHLVNLSPRNHRQTGQCQQQYQAYRANYTVTELSATPSSQSTHRPRPSEPGGARSPPEIMIHRSKATKLPASKTLTERARDQRNQTPSPTGIPKLSSAIFSSGGSGGHSGGRDQYWSKLCDRSERDSPLSHRASYVRSRKSDQNSSPSHGHSRPQSQHFPQDQPTGRGSSPRSGIPSPNSHQTSGVQSSRQEIPRNPESQRKVGKNGDSWVSLELNDNTAHRSDRTDTATDSSSHSNSSISPVSAEESLTDWEDRFVVNMPSAKDPNPPTMTAQQIAEYQKSIEKARREGRHTIEPPAGQSPRIGSPAGARRRSPPRDDSIGSFRAYDGGSTQPLSDTDHSSAQPQQDNPAEQSQQQRSLKPQQDYYSPDEIGKNRISTIWEESPTKQREKRPSQAADGSFLGCKEINGPGTKNPDEILLFGSGEDSGSLHPRPLAVGGRKRQKEERKKSSGGHSVPRRSGDRSLFQEEWAEVSRNSKHVPCSKRSVVTLCQDPRYSEHEIPRTGSQGSEKENSRPIENPSRSKERLEDTRGDDDVFIIIPTITRTMIPMAEKRQPEKKPSTPKPQGLRRPGDTGQSGTGEAVKAIRAKPQVISSPSGLRPAAGPLQPSSIMPSEVSSKVTQPSGIPTPKEAPSIVKGMKEPKYAKESKGTPPRKSSPGKEKNEVDRSTASSSIRGFIRTSGLARSGGLVRSPTDSLATILRNGTESLRNRAESLRNSRKGSPISLPSRDNSDSSRSEKSFKSAKESPRATPPPSVRPSPKRNSPTSKLSSAERPPAERKPSFEKSPPRPVVNKAVSTENPPAVEKSPPGKLSRAERLEKFKEEARIRRANKMASEKVVDVDIVGIAELDGHQVTGRKNKLQSNITDVNDVCEDLHELNAREKDDYSRENINPVALSMIFEIVVVAVTNMHRLTLQVTDSPYAKFVASNVVSMVRHCYQVFTRVIHAVAQYQATGTWPKLKDDKAISRFLVELLQAVVYLAILGFSAMIVYRAASYALLVASWFLWLARPFTWVFNCTTRALIM
ncbi:uncharacterized protein N7496_009388 [Penicillium cataractarum]|uniref:NTP binding protein n=1 Tax=Penicillium cataractarum TaxID=2100454 RepID=A0A9W9RQ91_9EURO|nr:uncharacterized protein N7496_009388 [Penicillium cataractarum]KAJ5363675.1 hypothetical protein N7496_009388 [Penicillium cataractarum]